MKTTEQVIQEFRKKFIKNGGINKDVVAYDLSNIEAFIAEALKDQKKELTKQPTVCPTGTTVNYTMGYREDPEKF